jgi:hypothetical protein
VAQLLYFFDTYEVFVKTYQVINESLTFYWVSTALSVCLYSSVTDSVCLHVLYMYVCMYVCMQHKQTLNKGI